MHCNSWRGKASKLHGTSNGNIPPTWSGTHLTRPSVCPVPTIQIIWCCYFCEGGCRKLRQSYLPCGNECSIPHRESLCGSWKNVPMFLCYENNYNETVVERLTAMGYEVERLNCYASISQTARSTPKEDYDTVKKNADRHRASS